MLKMNLEVTKIKKKARKYCKKLFAEDARIEEIVLIGSIVNGGFNEKSDIDIVCVFNPDFENHLEGYSIIFDLIKKSGYEIEGYPVDLGFITEGGNIFMGGGLISRYKGDYEVIKGDDLQWPTN